MGANAEGSGKVDQRQLNEIVVSVTACQDQQLSDSKLLREIEASVGILNEWKETMLNGQRLSRFRHTDGGGD